MITPNEKGLVLCPNCKKLYEPILQRKTDKLIQEEYPRATKEEREQLISGLCCYKCWNAYLGCEGEYGKEEV